MIRLNFHCTLFSGALVNAAKIHETALHIAAREGYPDIAEILIEYGANVFASNNQNKLPIDLVQAESGRMYNLLKHHSGNVYSFINILLVRSYLILNIFSKLFLYMSLVFTSLW